MEEYYGSYKFLKVEPSDIYKCPKCGWEGTHGWYCIAIDGESEKHCMRCYLKWISDNVPKMEKMK
jgi:hypothetical protein